MAACNFCFILCFKLLFLLQATKSVQVIEKCEGENVTFEFPYNESLKSVDWEYNHNKIATRLGNNFKWVQKSSNGRMSIGKMPNIVIEDVRESDKGLYCCNIQGNIGITNTCFELKILVLPRNDPYFEFERSEDGTVKILTCYPPLKDGSPQGKTYLKDSSGIIQSSLRISVNDYKYECCNEMPKCKFKHCIDFQVKKQSKCDSTAKSECVGVGLLLWMITSIISIITSVLLSLKCNRKHDICVNWRRILQYCKGLIGSILVLGLFSLACVWTEDCSDKRVPIILGVLSALTFPIFSHLANQINKRQERNKTEQNEPDIQALLQKNNNLSEEKEDNLTKEVSKEIGIKDIGQNEDSDLD